VLYLLSTCFLPVVFSARNKRNNGSYLDKTEDNLKLKDKTEDNQKLKAAMKEVHSFFNTLPPSVHPSVPPSVPPSVLNPKNVFRGICV
jgi:hypothetical protein